MVVEKAEVDTRTFELSIDDAHPLLPSASHLTLQPLGSMPSTFRRGSSSGTSSILRMKMADRSSIRMESIQSNSSCRVTGAR